MKKTGIILLLVAIIASTLAFAAYGQTANAAIVIEDTTVLAGEEFDVPVKITGNPGVASIGITVSFGEGIELVGAQNNGIFSGMSFVPPKQLSKGASITGSCRFAWLGSDNVEGDGVILTLTFIADPSIVDDTDVFIEITCDDVYNEYRDPVAIDTGYGIVTVINYIPGDVDGNGVINMLDVLMLCQYYVDGCRFDPYGYAVSINENAGDVDANGVLNMLDVLLICQYYVDGCQYDPDGYAVILLPGKMGGGSLPPYGDFDGDGLTNLNELINKTNPRKPDTDGDGLNDGAELLIHFTDPLDPDSDGDGAYDGWEVANGFDPNYYNSSFSVTITPDVEDEVTIGIKMDNLAGDQAQTITVTESEDESLKQLDGTIGKAYDFEIEGEFDEATIEFEFDASLNGNADFDPVIVYVDDSSDASKFYTLDTTVKGNVASAKVDSAATYMFVDRTLFKEKNKFRDIWSDSYSEAEVVFVIDDSGSMTSTDQNNTRLTTAKNIVDRLGNGTNVKFGVVRFASKTSILTNSLTNNRTTIKNYFTTSYFSSYGNTYMFTAVRDALSLYSSDASVLKIMIVLSDGDTFDTSMRDSVISQLKTNGVTAFTIGLGTSASSSYFTNYLKPLAEQTGGAYNFANASNDLYAIFDNIGDQIDLVTDTDKDGIVDYYEDNYEDMLYANVFNFSKLFPLDKNNRDSDGDGVPDGKEIKMMYYYYDSNNPATVMITGVVVSDPTDPSSK